MAKCLVGSCCRFSFLVCVGATVLGLAVGLGLAACGGGDNKTDDSSNNSTPQHKLIDGIPQLTASPTLSNATVGQGGTLEVQVPVDGDTLGVIVSVVKYEGEIALEQTSVNNAYANPASSGSADNKTVTVLVPVSAAIPVGSNYGLSVALCSTNLVASTGSSYRLCPQTSVSARYVSTVRAGVAESTLSFTYSHADSLTTILSGPTAFTSPTVTVNASSTSASPSFSITMVAPTTVSGTVALHLFNADGTLVGSAYAPNTGTAIEPTEREFVLHPIASSSNNTWSLNTAEVVSSLPAGTYTLYFSVIATGVTLTVNDYAISKQVVIGSGATSLRFTLDQAYSGTDRVIVPHPLTGVGLSGTHSDFVVSNGQLVYCTIHSPGIEIYSSTMFLGHVRNTVITTVSNGTFSFGSGNFTIPKGRFGLTCLVDANTAGGANVKNSGDHLYEADTPIEITTTGNYDITAVTFSHTLVP
jgi:hypothetical protein